MAKIGFVSTLEGHLWGGSEELWSKTAIRLVEKGNTVGANLWRRSAPVPQIEHLAQNGCLVTIRRDLRRISRFTGYLPLKWLDVFKPDLVVISMGSHLGGELWMDACKKRGIKYVVIVQAIIEFNWEDSDATHRSAQWYESANAVYCVSMGNLEFLRTYLSSDLKNAKVVRNPVNVALDSAPEWPSTQGGFHLACVGRLQMDAKGQDLIIRLLSMEKWRNRQIHVSLYGSGPHRESIKRNIQRCSLNNLVLEGHVDNPVVIWERNHALLMPSRYEGLPLSVVEAMLCGRPCIVTDVAGNAEVVQDNINGFLAAGPNLKSLDEAMERAWNRRDEWRRMGKAAAEQIREFLPADPIETFAQELLSRL